MISPVKIWRRQKEIRKILGKRGKILTWTKIHIAGVDFKKYAPYIVVLVEFDNKERAYGQLVDWDGRCLKTGKKVMAILRKVREPTKEGVIGYGAKFKQV